MGCDNCGGGSETSEFLIEVDNVANGDFATDCAAYWNGETFVADFLLGVCNRRYYYACPIRPCAWEIRRDDFMMVVEWVKVGADYVLRFTLSFFGLGDFEEVIFEHNYGATKPACDAPNGRTLTFVSQTATGTSCDWSGATVTITYNEP
jgi:hypothetical protein